MSIKEKKKARSVTLIRGVAVTLFVITLATWSPWHLTTPNPHEVSPSFHGVAEAVASRNWTGEFQYSFTGAQPGGSYLVTGSGSFTFTINPANNSVTGTGNGRQSFVAHAQCSGGGDTSYTFTIDGVYDPIFNTFNIGASRGVPEYYTFPEQPSQICNPLTFDVGYGFLPTAAVIPALDGATFTCPNSNQTCDPRVTYKITIHGSQFCTSTGGQKLIFYAEKDGFPSGHGFMQFETNAGAQAYRTDLVYGHSSVSGPFNDGVTRGPGAPQHGLLEADHPWDWRIVFHVSPCQYDDAANFVNSEIAHPSPYSLTSLNCVDWINMVAAAAGLQLPPSTDGFGVSDPLTLATSFENIGNGGSFGGGVVQQNTQGLTPQNTPDPPWQNEVLASPAELQSYALANASALALSQNMSFQQIALNPVTLATSGALNISLQKNFVENYSLAITDFADGSSSKVTLSSHFSHAFNSSGTYAVSIAVLTAATLDVFLLNVTVTPVAAPRSVNISINVPFATSTSSSTSSGQIQKSAESVSEMRGIANQSGESTVSSVFTISSGSTFTASNSPSFVSSSASQIQGSSAYAEAAIATLVVLVAVVGIVFVRRARRNRIS